MSFRSPRRVWWSPLCTLRCSVRWMMRALRMAICTSGEPVSVSWRRYSEMVACLSGMWGIDLWNLGDGRRTEHAGAPMLAGSQVVRYPQDGGSDPAAGAGSDPPSTAPGAGPVDYLLGWGVTRR